MAVHFVLASRLDTLRECLFRKRIDSEVQKLGEWEWKVGIEAVCGSGCGVPTSLQARQLLASVRSDPDELLSVICCTRLCGEKAFADHEGDGLGSGGLGDSRGLGDLCDAAWTVGHQRPHDGCVARPIVETVLFVGLRDGSVEEIDEMSELCA